MENLLTTKATLQNDFEAKMARGGIMVNDPVVMRPTLLGGKIAKANTPEMYEAAMGLQAVGAENTFRFSGKYGSGFDTPMKWSNGATMSVREAVRTGVLKLPSEPQMSSNTLLPDWQNLWDAMRIDLSIRKTAQPTIREFLYNVRNTPNATRTMKVTELFPHAMVFDEVNGEGQAVPQGESRGGNYDTVEFKIYAAGFTWTLLAELFDQLMDMNSLADAVALGYNAKRDDLAIDPILSYGSYGSAGTAKHTGANATEGAVRQELLYLTMEDALDDLGDREDPITGRKIDVSGSVVLASEYDARHISRVAQGLPSVNERSYPALSEIGRVIGYNGETITLRDRTVTYDGVTQGTAYLIKPNRYMMIPIKRGLQVEVDMTPDVKTLSREERAYWFCESVYTEGIQYFVQKITLPSW